MSLNKYQSKSKKRNKKMQNKKVIKNTSSSAKLASAPAPGPSTSAPAAAAAAAAPALAAAPAASFQAKEPLSGTEQRKYPFKPAVINFMDEQFKAYANATPEVKAAMEKELLSMISKVEKSSNVKNDQFKWFDDYNVECDSNDEFKEEKEVENIMVEEEAEEEADAAYELDEKDEMIDERDMKEIEEIGNIIDEIADKHNIEWKDKLQNMSIYNENVSAMLNSRNIDQSFVQAIDHPIEIKKNEPKQIVMKNEKPGIAKQQQQQQQIPEQEMDEMESLAQLKIQTLNKAADDARKRSLSNIQIKNAYKTPAERRAWETSQPSRAAAAAAAMPPMHMNEEYQKDTSITGAIRMTYSKGLEKINYEKLFNTIVTTQENQFVAIVKNTIKCGSKEFIQNYIVESVNNDETIKDEDIKIFLCASLKLFFE